MIGILGLGNMGAAATYFAAKTNVGVRAFDLSCERVNKEQEFLDQRWQKGKISRVNCIHATELIEILNAQHSHKPFSIILSCLPYHQNLEVAKWCIQHEVAYTDLGGSVEVSEQIKDIAQNSKVPIMSDLGLAPGLISFYTLKILNECPLIPTDINLYCGGLPASHLSFGWPKMNPLRYGVNWNIDGLYNEYISPCQILVNGEIRTEKALEGLQDFNKECDAFFTSGGIAHLIRYLKEKGIKNASYRTLRYKGHLEIIKMLIENMSEEEFKKFMVKACPKKDDQVYIYIKYSWYDEGVNIGEFSKVIHSTPMWSAMQLATVIPAISVVNCIRDKRYYNEQSKFLQYEDINLYYFFLELNRLGL